jgi:diguanylate cyclase (GGDEF)-like protein
MSFEALLSSFAVSLRVRHILGERDLARAEESAARRLSEIDPLTGLQNRRALLANAVNMAPDEPLHLLLVDIDFFKSINDTYGLEVGDEVLREFASVLARCLEIRGTAARMGGEEFALLGPAGEITDDLALEILAQIRATVMPEGIRITASIGSAIGVVAQESDWRDLYRRADAALYDAKRSGRNCHVMGQAARKAVPAVAAA